MARRFIVAVLLITFLLVAGGLVREIWCERWNAATTYATLLVGFVATGVVIWQGYLIKRQLAFSTYLELDKEWNSEEMIDARQVVHAPGTEEWDHSRLEGILEFFEKLASMFLLSADMPFIYQSTLGWYAVRYFLFARHHGQITYLRRLWKDDLLYADLQALYRFYIRREVYRGKKSQSDWEKDILTTEDKFWEQERKD
jgi:hypothetical protein